MQQISDLSRKIIAYAEDQNFDTDEAVAWAVDMVQLGYDTSNLLMLAACAKPTNYFETIEYLRLALAELGMKPKYGEEAIISYCNYYLVKIATGFDIRKNLSIVYSNCQQLPVLLDFCLLHWAWDDLDHGNTYQEYWPNANNANIEQLVMQHAQKWLEQEASS